MRLCGCDYCANYGLRSPLKRLQPATASLKMPSRVRKHESMAPDKFGEYMERTLGFEESFGRGGREALCEAEKLAWDLHAFAAPAGSVLLADKLIRNRVSYCHRQLNVLPFARKLLEEAFVSLSDKAAKNPWDWYWFGICHASGRGTPVDHGRAADCFRRAREAGNPYAHYEEIWSAYLSGVPTLETIYRFRYCSGPLQKFARRSARALALLEMGPPRELGSGQQICRILEISELLHEFYFHDGGHRHINVQVGKEMRLDVDSLKTIATPPAFLTLFLIATKSPTNPTGRAPEAWLRAAVHPDNRPLLALAKREILAQDQLGLIAEVCRENGWGESDICRFAEWALAHADGEDDGSSAGWFP